LHEKRKNRVVRELLSFWLPIGILLCILAVTNWSKFGSPLATGYTQWEKEAKLFTAANIFPALWGYLFSPHHSIFLHYPVLFFALAGWPGFFRKNRLDAVVAALFAFTLLLVSSMFVNWSGQSCYGPRYLLPIIPILGLPFIEYLKWLVTLPKVARSVLAAGTTALLAYSTLLQVSINTLPFFFGYDLSEMLDEKRYSKSAIYLRSHDFGTINRDFLLYKFGCASPFTASFVLPLNLAESEKMSALTESVQANYYWFPRLLE
jgi:hypothetical protein